jgi:hypothetical protein
MCHCANQIRIEQASINGIGYEDYGIGCTEERGPASILIQESNLHRREIRPMLSSEGFPSSWDQN